LLDKSLKSKGLKGYEICLNVMNKESLVTPLYSGRYLELYRLDVVSGYER